MQTDLNLEPSTASLLPSVFERDFLRRPREPGISRLSRIPTHENGEPLVPLAGLSPRVRLKCPLPWARETVAGMLKQAAESLPGRMRLVIGTTLRSVRMQEKAYWSYYEHVKRTHPEWPPATLRREVNRFFHPPDYPTAPPGHCTGGAVDVAVALGNGRQIDMASSVVGDQRTWMTFDRRLTPQARANRAMLYDIMLGVGFTNCYDEWWHYSYGDTGWAERGGHPCALYGIPTEFPGELAELIRRVETRTPRRLHR